MAYAAVEQAAVASDLMKEAFPKPGFTKCYSDRGKINWNAVKRIEDSQGAAGVNAVSTYIVTNIQPCMTSANPKFVENLQNTCKTNSGSQNQSWLCQAVGTPVHGAQAPANTAVLAISSAQADQLLQTAVPKSSSPIDSCPASSGRLNWSIAKQLDQNGFQTQVQKRLMEVVLPCISEKNKNMVSELEDTCRIPVDLNEQNVICGRVATLRKRQNGVTTALQQAAAQQAAAQQAAAQQAAAQQGPAPQAVEQQGAAEQAAAPSCPNLDAEKAKLVDFQNQLATYKEQISQQVQERMSALEAYQKQLDEYRQSLEGQNSDGQLAVG